MVCLINFAFRLSKLSEIVLESFYADGADFLKRPWQG